MDDPKAMPTFLVNVLSRYKQMGNTIYALLGDARELRARLDATQITKSFVAGDPLCAPGPLLSAISFPAPGDVSYIDHPDKLLAFVAALAALETNLSTAQVFTNAAGSKDTPFLPASAIAVMAG